MVDSALSYEGMEDRHRLCFETLCTLEKYTMDRKGSQADHISYLPSLFKSREAQEVDVVVVEAALQGSEVVEAAVQAVEGLDMATVNKNNENEKLFSTSQSALTDTHAASVLTDRLQRLLIYSETPQQICRQARAGQILWWERRCVRGSMVQCEELFNQADCCLLSSSTQSKAF